VSQKISILPHRGFFGFEAPPFWKFQFRFIPTFINFGHLDPLLSVVGVWIFSGTTQWQCHYLSNKTPVSCLCALIKIIASHSAPEMA